MKTVRIDVLDPAALDGTTDLDLAATGVTRVDNPTLGLITVTIPAGMAFGRFEPGEILGTGGPNLTLSLLSASVIPDNGVAVDGDVVSLVSPPLPSAARRSLEVVNLLTETDIANEVAQTIPVGHLLSFTTQTANGPWRIQCTFTQIRDVKGFLNFVPTVLA